MSGSGSVTDSPQPVNFVWLERKVIEWGCMQALIDFDGWRQWKDFASEDKVAAQNNVAANKKILSEDGARGTACDVLY